MMNTNRHDIITATNINVISANNRPVVAYMYITLPRAVKEPMDRM